MAKAQELALFTSADVSRMVGITANGVRQARQRGDLVPKITTPGGLHLFDAEGVERFRARREARRKAMGLASEA